MFNPEKHHRRSIRLPGYDYAQAGLYFVTICAKNREYLFGEIIDGSMRLNPFGTIVRTCWDNLPQHYSYVNLDAFVVMPNHVHGIIVMTDQRSRGGVTPPLLRVHTLGQIVAYFKYQSTKQINVIRDMPGVPVWQRNYHEHIIRNEKALTNIRRYIVENPLHWAFDAENLAVIDHKLI